MNRPKFHMLALRNVPAGTCFTKNTSPVLISCEGRIALELLKEQRWPKASLLQGSLMPTAGVILWTYP
jgi:hypothetical protein